MIFAGDELGLSGVNGEDARRPMPWHRPQLWNRATQETMRTLIGLRRGLDGARHGVRVGEGFVELTRTEYQLLELLMLNAGRVLPHDLIYERVWGYDFGPASNALRVYIGYLRRKLEQAGARPLLHTVRGVGYVLREP